MAATHNSSLITGFRVLLITRHSSLLLGAVPKW